MTEQLTLFDPRSPRISDAADTTLRVRESRKARRLTLRLVPPNTLELVVPRGTRPADVAAFVHAHRRWIQRARGEIDARVAAGGDRLPASIELTSIGRILAVHYRHDPGSRPQCRVRGDRLEIRTPQPEHAAARVLLRRWLLGEARAHLPPWLLREAEVVGREPRSVQVRLQRTRWGSCSSAGNISLNAGLLFLEPALVRYLMIHELCHLVSLNHSQRFWRAVERFEPAYRVLDRRLSKAWADLPWWAHDSGTPAGVAFEGV
jgi:predicted metal-dependent hydrolase